MALCILGGTLVWVDSACAQITNIQNFRLLADYTLDGTAEDRTGNSAPMELSNTTFTNGTLYLNGLYEFDDPQGFHALARISGFSYESFTVALDFFAADYSNDNILTGGPSYRWFSLRHNAGRLEVTLNNQSLVYFLPDGALRTNQWQNVLCSVDASAKRIITVLEGRRLQDIVLSPGFSFEVIGSPVEDSDRIFMFANYGNASVFHGYVDNLKVWNRALNSPEIDAMLSAPDPVLSIEKAVVVSWPRFPLGFVLQSSTDINGPYQNYPGTIFTDGAESKAVVPLGSSQRFFHLVKP